MGGTWASWGAPEAPRTLGHLGHLGAPWGTLGHICTFLDTPGSSGPGPAPAHSTVLVYPDQSQVGTPNYPDQSQLSGPVPTIWSRDAFPDYLVSVMRFQSLFLDFAGCSGPTCLAICHRDFCH